MKVRWKKIEQSDSPLVIYTPYEELASAYFLTDGTLPPWATIDHATGEIRGVAREVGTWTFEINGASVTITVEP